MKYDELIDGEIYSTVGTNGGSKYTFIKNSEPCGKNQIYKVSGGFYSNNGGDLRTPHNSLFKDYELATQQEKDHLLACIKAGKYVDYKPEIINDYELY